MQTVGWWEARRSKHARLLAPSFGNGASACHVAKRSLSYHEITTKPLDLPRNLARFRHGLQRFARPRHFAQTTKSPDLRYDFRVGAGPFSGPRGRRFKSSRPDLQQKSIWQNDLRNGRYGGRCCFLGMERSVPCQTVAGRHRQWNDRLVPCQEVMSLIAFGSTTSLSANSNGSR